MQDDFGDHFYDHFWSEQVIRDGWVITKNWLKPNTKPLCQVVRVLIGDTFGTKKNETEPINNLWSAVYFFYVVLSEHKIKLEYLLH